MVYLFLILHFLSHTINYYNFLWFLLNIKLFKLSQKKITSHKEITHIIWKILFFYFSVMFKPFTPSSQLLKNDVEVGRRRAPSRGGDRRVTIRYPVIKRNRFRHNVDGNRRSPIRNSWRDVPVSRWWNPRKQHSRSAWPAPSSSLPVVAFRGAIKPSVYRRSRPTECRKTRRRSELSTLVHETHS